MAILEDVNAGLVAELTNLKRFLRSRGDVVPVKVRASKLTEVSLGEYHGDDDDDDRDFIRSDGNDDGGEDTDAR